MTANLYRFFSFLMNTVLRRHSSLAGRKALITGSSQGIGLGIAEVFLENGLEEIVIHDIHEEEDVLEILENLRSYSHSPNVHYLQSDVRDGSNCRDLVKDSFEKMGGVDILVNNAGIQRINPIEDFLDEDWNDLIATNLSSNFFTTSELVKQWKSTNCDNLWGRIINISSVHGIVASIEKVGYISAKHGLVGLTKVAALELANYDVTCNTICPGWIGTDLALWQVEKMAEDRGVSYEEAEYMLLSEKQPKAKFSYPEDIGEICLFLCSETARNITGSSIVIDGGWSTQ